MGPRFVVIAILLTGLVLAPAATPLAQSAPFEWRWPFRKEAADKERTKEKAGRNLSAPFAPSVPQPRELSDQEIATCARAAFWQDQELAPLNLEVSVDKGVATVDGPVPSDYLRRKAVALVERLRGIRGVKDQVRVRSSPASNQPAQRHFPAVDQPWPERPQFAKPAEQPLKAPTVDSDRPGALMSRPAAEENPSTPSTPRTPSAKESWQPATGRGYWLPASGVKAGLLPPEVHPPGAPPSSDVGLRRPVVMPREHSTPLASRIQEVLSADARYAEVRFILIGQTVYLRGFIGDQNARLDLIQTLERMKELDLVRSERLETQAK